MQKVAATIFFGLLLHVIFSSIGSDFDLAFTYWLFYALICGVIINYDNINKHKQLFAYSIPSPTVLVIVTYYRITFQGYDNCWFSGGKCLDDPLFHKKMIAFWFGSTLSIWILSYLSQWIIELGMKTFNLPDDKAKKIKSRIIWVGAIVTAIIGVVQIFAHGWGGK